jgi:hypothetical protein
MFLWCRTKSWPGLRAASRCSWKDWKSKQGQSATAYQIDRRSGLIGDSLGNHELLK